MEALRFFIEIVMKTKRKFFFVLCYENEKYLQVKVKKKVVEQKVEKNQEMIKKRLCTNGVSGEERVGRGIVGIIYRNEKEKKTNIYLLFTKSLP